MTLLLTYIALAVGVSFFCSVLEATLLSLTPAFIAGLRETRPQLGARLSRLHGSVDRPLSAILSLNTIANTLGAAAVGAQAQRLWGSDALAVVSALLTFLILVFAEIIPKTLGAVFWRRLAPMASIALPMMIGLLFPLVWASEHLTNLVKRGGKERGAVSREDVAALARLGGQQGALDASESRILEGLFRFRELYARDIMTPRTVVFALAASMRVGEAIKQHRLTIFSRIPIYEDGVEDVHGYVLKDDLLLRAAKDELELPLSELAREMLIIPDSLPLPALFEQLVAKRQQIALIVDEYGGFDGIVTMEDLLETLLGFEIVDEADRVKDMREMARRRWERKARMLESERPGPPEINSKK
ncbi:MAG: HlyC/CorC family transporter [Deltaproteobacteria bacterium]|nr:HlyC/CorC family transporter [Deltaproteobacteria bacterium]